MEEEEIQGQYSDPYAPNYIGPTNTGEARPALAPWDYVIGGAVAGKKAITAWGADKVFDVGMQAIAPDVEETILEQGLKAAKFGLGAKVSRGVRVTKNKLNEILTDVFDTRIPNPFRVGEFASSTGTGFGPRDINPPDGSVNLGLSGKPLRNTGGNPYLTYAERKGISPVPPKEELIRREKLGSDWQNIDNSTLDPSQTRNWAKYERDEAAYFLENRWPRDKEFNELGDLIKKQLEKLYPDIPLSSWRRHHTNPLKQGAQLLNGLKPQFRKEAVQIMFGEGLSAGHNPNQLAVIPHKVHVKIHNFINQRIGKDTVALLETKWLKPGQKIEDIPWPERREIIMEYAQIVKSSNEKIYDMMTAIAVNKKYGPNALPEVLAKLNSKVDATDVGLDDLLKEIKLELNLQDIAGTVPKIDVLELAQQWMDDPVKMKVLQRKMEGATMKELKKEFGNNLNVNPDLFKQLTLFDQMTPTQYQQIQRLYGLGGKGSIRR